MKATLCVGFVVRCQETGNADVVLTGAAVASLPGSAIRSRMQVQENKAYLESQQQNVDDRLQHLKASLGESGYVTGLRPSSG